MSGRASVEVTALRQAEIDASQIVRAAREERKLRMRDAVREADATITRWEAEKRERLRSRHPAEEEMTRRAARLEAATNAEVERLTAAFASRKDLVLKLLETQVLEVIHATPE